jgi:hypothetical protein
VRITASALYSEGIKKATAVDTNADANTAQAIVLRRADKLVNSSANVSSFVELGDGAKVFQSPFVMSSVVNSLLTGFLNEVH